MRKSLILLSALLLAGIGAKAQSLSGDYLIMDADGYYLGGGLTWGTQAAIIGKPQFIGFEGQTGENVYHLDSHQYNSADSHYLGSNLYFDSTPVDWTITTVDGGYTIYGTDESNVTGYLTSNGFQNVPTVESSPYVWTLVTKDDVITSMSNATSTAPVDVTALIAAPELKRNSNTSYYPTWTVSGYDGTGTPSNYAFGSGNATANCAESYHSTNGFNINQTITLPKAGYYTLSAKGFYRDDSSATLLLPVLYAGEQTSTFPVLNTSANTMAEAYAEFLNGQHSIDPITIQTTEENKEVTIGFKGEDTSLWNIFGELELLYYGTEAPALPDHECTADIDHWTISGNTNGDFHLNDWSTEDDESGMVVPFLEYWVWSGEGNLSAATISHETITGLTPGVYTVSMDIRIFSEAGNEIGEGTTFNANNASEDIVSGSDGTSDVYGTETEEYGTYTLTCIVYDDGTLDISIVIPEGVEYNWIAFKNLSVTYSGPVTEPSIGKAKAKTVVTPGEEVTITFQTAAPEDSGYTLSGSEFTDTGSGITVSYTSGGVFTFTVPEDAESNSTFTITLPEGALKYSDTEISSAEQTLTFTVPYILADDLMEGMFLQNLYGGDLLSRGKDYGTRADVDFIGIPLALVMNDDGKYVIRYADADLSSAEYNYLYGPNWAWADGSALTATTFTIEEVYNEEKDSLLGYHFISDLGYLYRYDADKANATDTDDNYALAVNGAKGDNYSDDNQVIWTFVGIEERDAIKAAWVASQKVAIATEAGLTGITTGDEFDAYVATMAETAIVENEISASTETNWTGGTYTAQGVESYQTATRLSRSFSDLEPGIYKITLNGLDRNSDNAYSWQMYKDGYTDLSESYIYANDYEINLKAWGSEATYSSSTYTPNDMTEASTMFGEGKYLNTLYTYVGEEGTLNIQIALLVTEYFGWAQVKNFSLYRLYEPIEWTLGAEYGTLILPFDYDLSNTGLTAYTGAINSDGNEMELTAVTDNAITAYTPYIIGGTADTYTFSGVPGTETATTFTSGVLTGVLEKTTVESGNYVLQNQNGTTAFYLVAENGDAITCGAYHCYLNGSAVSGTGVKSITFTFGDDVATRIDAVETEETANEAIYDLSGRRVAKAQKGIYIVNGKKMVIK